MHHRQPPYQLLFNCFCQVYVKLAPCFWKTRLLNLISSMIFIHNRYYLPLEKDVVLHLYKLESLLSNNAQSRFWLKLVEWFQRRFFCVNVFLQAWFFIWPSLIFLLFTKFGLYWPSNSGEEDLKILSMYFHFFIIIPP